MDLTRKRKWHECESMCSRKVSSSCFFKNLPGFKVTTLTVHWPYYCTIAHELF